MKFFARVTAGLEEIAWSEIQLIPHIKLEGFGHRRIDFTYDRNPDRLLELKSVDDVYVYVARLQGLDHTRRSLETIHNKFKDIDLKPALDTISMVRNLEASIGYRITTSYLGRRNYSRYEIEDSIAEAVDLDRGWTYIPNRSDDYQEPELDLRILLEDDWALVGMRLGVHPLHRRDYKIASVPGSLKAPVAASLCLLAAMRPDNIMLDLSCGAGTILIESSPFLPNGRIIGGDLDATALQNTQANILSAGLQYEMANDHQTLASLLDQKSGSILLYEGDAQQPHVPAESVDIIISNLPWDRQVKVDDGLIDLYTTILVQISRVLKPNGRAVLLSAAHSALDAALKAMPQLHITATQSISLFGSHPMIFMLEKQ